MVEVRNYVELWIYFFLNLIYTFYRVLNFSVFFILYESINQPINVNMIIIVSS